MALRKSKGLYSCNRRTSESLSLLFVFLLTLDIPRILVRPESQTGQQGDLSQWVARVVAIREDKNNAVSNGPMVVISPLD